MSPTNCPQLAGVLAAAILGQVTQSTENYMIYYL